MPPWRGSTPRSCSGIAGEDVGQSHENIITKREFPDGVVEVLVNGAGSLAEKQPTG